MPPGGKPDLWKEAYENIRKDPDDSAIYADFREIINNERGRGQEARLSSESGRKDLLSLIDKRRDSLAAKRTSPKVQQVFTVADKARNVISLGAAANPFSTVAVAGLFIAFDIRKMYTDASQAMLDIAIEIAGIICRAGVESREINQQGPNEPQELVDLRDRLRGDYVQLYRTILILTMRLVRTLSSKRRALFAGLSNWPDDRLNLEKMESRVIKSLDSVSRWRTNMPSQPANWGIQGRNELHNAARYGQTTEVFNLIKSGKCGSAILNGQSYRGWTALMFAIENGHYDIMDMLLECKGIDINIRNSIGRTAVYMAAVKGRSWMVRRLVQVGAKVDVRDNRGRTAWLMCVCSRLTFNEVTDSTVRTQDCQIRTPGMHETPASWWSGARSNHRNQRLQVCWEAVSQLKLSHGKPYTDPSKCTP